MNKLYTRISVEDCPRSDFSVTCGAPQNNISSGAGDSSMIALDSDNGTIGCYH